MIKIITLDLDGTLMSPDHLTVSEANRQALKEAHEKGIKIAISTGRTLAIMGDICEQVPEVDYIMYSNGAAVIDRKTNKNIYTNYISNSFGREMLEYIDKRPCFYEVYVDAKSYVPVNKAELFAENTLPKEFIDNLLDKLCACENVLNEIGNRDIEKITVYSKYPEVYDEVYKHFSSMTDKLSVSSSLRGNIDMTRAGVDKGVALDGMCRALGFTADEAMSFGDAGNDCPMLEYAKYSFAMENGSDDCKKSAKFTTKSNAEDGVAYAIRKYAL